MFKNLFVTLKLTSLVAILTIGVGQSVYASITFSEADLLSMTVADSFNAGFFGQNDGTMTSATAGYADGASPMRGVAGSTAFAGNGGYVYYSLTGTELAAFQAAVDAGEDTLEIVGFNDNDDSWVLGVYYQVGSVRTFDEALLAGFHSSNSPNNQAFSVSGMSGQQIAQVGVYIRFDNLRQSGGDAYHASWSGVPEPTSIAIWSVVAGLSLVGVRRRRK